jgi:hypothetical protein
MPQTAGYGTNQVPLFATVTNTVAPTVAGTNGQQFVCLGWAGTGNVSASGATNTVVFAALTNSTLTWLWQMQFQMTAQAVSNGMVTPGGGWFNAGSNVSVLATPAAYFDFDHWTGDLQGTTNPVTLSMTGSKTVTAYFAAQLVTNGVPKWWLATNNLPVSDAAALADGDGDGFANWQEFQYHTNPNLADTDGDGYADGLEVARGSDPTLASSIPRVPLVINSSPAGIGSPQPQGYGTFSLPLFGGMTNAVADPVYQSSGTRYLNLGWSGTGDVPATGVTNQVTFNLNTNSTLTWLWRVQYGLTLATNFSTGNGFVPRGPLASLLANDLTSYDGFGWSVAVDGEVAVVGAPFHQGPNAYALGGVYVFRRSGTNWNYEAFLDGADSTSKSFVGCSVAICSNRVALGALSGSSRYCTAYVYAKSGSNWTRETVLSTSQPAADWDAWGISLNQNFLSIGASGDPYRGSLAGSVFVFWRSGSSWPTSGLRLTPTDYKPYQFFGSSIAAAGTNLLIVGAPGDTVGRSCSGAAYVFRVNGSQSYTQEAKLVSTNAAPQAGFGASVAAVENLLVVGAPSDETHDVPSGAAYVYVRTNAVWTNTARLTPDSGEPYAAFGNAVAVTTNRVLVGAPQAFGASSRSGSTWLYQLSGATWQPQAQLGPIAAIGEDQFGWAVALSSDAVLAGAPDGDQSALDAGAAYLFNPSGLDVPATWWDASSVASMPTAPETLTQSNVVYRFVEWQLDGLRQTTASSAALNPLPPLSMNSAHGAMAVYLPETEDTDTDSLPDWWECRYLGTLATGPADDPDRDGFSNGQELLAGTNPFDAASTLRLTSGLLCQTQAAFELRWGSAPGKKYHIYSALTPSGPYSCLVSNVTATPPLNQASVPIQTGQMFFKLQLAP